MSAGETSGAADWMDWLALLSDLARVRLLRLVEQEELGVGELARVLQMPQSSVSRHLKPLFVGGWVAKRSEGTASLYRLAHETLPEAAQVLWRLTREQAGHQATFADDDHRLAEVVAERRSDSKSFFGRIGADWDHLRSELFGEAFSAEALLGLADPAWAVADIGCGTGNAAERMAPYFREVIAVDREPAMLDAARLRLARFDNIQFRQGELGSLPIRDAEIDAAIVMLVLHHVDDPAAAVCEIKRCLKPGGVLLVVDMVEHDRSVLRHTMGHVHLGFAEQDVRGWSGRDLALERHLRLRPDTEAKGPGLFLATFRRLGGRRPTA
ncbi:MAG: metalloregulator ArsR/SmtB family transcription factor [Phycisphaerales bacterium]|nr:metalloregulator ArsR/SmtB family transcription factor [Phycisphaerales bacterium]